jgi:DNA-binding NarL/FixJ family response regulator
MMEFLLKVVGLRKDQDKFEIDANLAQQIHELAAAERCCPKELAANLLAQAVAQKQQCFEHLELWETLSPREKEVVTFVCLGYMNKEIALKLGISVETVKTHVRNALRKFRVKRRGEIQRMLADWDFRKL